MFLSFGQNRASCSHKIVLIKNKRVIDSFLLFSGDGYIIEANILGKSKHQIVEGGKKVMFLFLFSTFLFCKGMLPYVRVINRFFEPFLDLKQPVNHSYIWQHSLAK